MTKNVLYADATVSKRAMRLAGITRLTNITSLDLLGVPVWTAFRADVAHPEMGNLSVYNGKALTQQGARLGAVLEAIERYSAETNDDSRLSLKMGTEAEFHSSRESVASPTQLFRPPKDHYRKTMTLEWVKGRELIQNQGAWIPAHAVFCPYVSPRGFYSTGHCSTVGLASGFSREAAIVSGLLEIIEHDAALHAEDKGVGVTVDLSGVRVPSLRKLVSKFKKTGLSLTVKDVSGRTGLYTFTAVCDDPITRNPLLLTGGQAAHFDPFVAMEKAILEAVQSRLTTIQGAREDLEAERFKIKFGYDRIKRELAYWYKPGQKMRSITTYQANPVSTPKAALRLVLNSLKKVGLNKAFVADLTRPEIGIPVIRAIVPGLRYWD